MRWIAFLLLGANLLFLGFRLLNPPSEDGRAQGDATGTEWSGAARLSRIAETGSDLQPRSRKPMDHAVPAQGVDEGPVAPTGMETVVSAGTTPSSHCYVAGFTDEEAAVNTKAALESVGITVSSPRTELVERVRYWVLLPPYRSDEQARTAVERLKRAGLKDYYLIPNGENKNALSLGVFSTREAAQRRISEVAYLNLKVRLEEVSFPGQRYLLDLSAASGQFPPEWQQVLPAGAELQTHICD